MKQVSAKLKNRGATAAVLMLALGAAVYLNWSFSREAPSSLVASEDIAADAVDLLSNLYPPGHTAVHLVPAKNVENTLVQDFEGGLRTKGFTLAPDARADAVAVAYTLDVLSEKGEERAWYLQLRIFDSKTGGISIARAYTPSGQPEAGQSRTETALKRSMLEEVTDTTRNALFE